MEQPYRATSGDRKSRVSVVGIPFDESSSYQRGARKAPERIRWALHCGATNHCSELGVELDASWFGDVGDLDLQGTEQMLEAVERFYIELLQRGQRPLALGGDHSITVPILRALRKTYDNLQIVHFDAHPDLYDEFEGNRFSHACPFARIMEERLASGLTQLGIRTANDHQKAQAERFGVKTIDMRSWRDHPRLSFSAPVYVSVDLDALDPSCAPGVSHHEPGGLTTRQLIDAIHGIDAEIVGADIVELNPDRDVGDMTAHVAAKLLKELAGKMAVR